MKKFKTFLSVIFWVMVTIPFAQSSKSQLEEKDKNGDAYYQFKLSREYDKEGDYYQVANWLQKSAENGFSLG